MTTITPGLILDPAITLPTDYGIVHLQYVALGEKEGVLATCGSGWEADPLYVRFQSSCIFSEAFHAKDCECGAQLLEAVRVASEHGGVIFYVFDEGRGAGLRNKFRAIALQQTRGLDTAAAYGELGLASDLRSFELPLAVLMQQVPVTRRIRLLTNNPRKRELLTSAGFAAVESVPLLCARTAAVAAYLEEKRRVLGHEIPTAEPEGGT